MMRMIYMSLKYIFCINQEKSIVILLNLFHKTSFKLVY